MLDLTQVKTYNSTRKMCSSGQCFNITIRKTTLFFRDLLSLFFRSDIVASTWELHEVNVLHNYDHVIQDNA